MSLRIYVNMNIKIFQALNIAKIYLEIRNPNNLNGMQI